ncbi:hypothetical protein HK099_004665 [Clydaea vesicula]|uniref:Cytochrome b5 heme-binding domain-containing protein n=1 Tax=Clydaea vesicula TaxID=447962 RepID=A0AAD5TZZ8_9FUNG|nr:hypothetical protein HK099_004665 [Clydaea vesicula]
MSKSFSRAEVAKNNTEASAWIIIDSIVYDITRFAGMHPGDATEAFYDLHRHEVLEKFGPKLKLGQVEGESQKIIKMNFADYSPVPYAEHPSVVGFKSPYYTQKHLEYRTVCRNFVAKHVLPDALACEETGARPSKELVKLLGEEGYLAARLGPGKHLKGLKLPGGIKPEEFVTHLSFVSKLSVVRVMCRGYADGNSGGMVIGLPPVFNFGSKALKEKIVGPVLRGEKYIALAISEAFAGSDVAGLKTRAEKSPCGKFYIVNGTKKWITGGMYADYFSTAVRTDKGITMLLIERGEGVRTKQISTSYSKTAGTAYIIFENVKVPVENILGVENKGFQVVMSNFNHERWVMCVGSVRGTKSIIEECFKWANQRKVFGRPLINQPVIRQKLASMVALSEALQHWLDHTTFQMNNLSYFEQATKLAGSLALLKYQCTRVGHYVSDNAVQIFGGRGITRTGMGRVIEGFQRTNKFDAILGGSEEILADLGIKQAVKNFPNTRL